MAACCINNEIPFVQSNNKPMETTVDLSNGMFLFRETKKTHK